MPYYGFGDSPTLYDLFAPLQFDAVAQQAMPSYAPPPTSYAPEFSTTVPAVQPSRFDTMADALVGQDRYQELSDESRRRALGNAMMALGQSLTAASLAPNYTEAFQQIGNAIPRAYGAFENRLKGEDEQRKAVEEEAYQRKQRAFTLGQQSRTEKKQSESDQEEDAFKQAAPQIVAELVAKANEYAADPKVASNPKAQILIADLKAKALLIGKAPRPETLNSLSESVYKLADIAGRGQEFIDDAAAKRVALAQSLGMTVEELAEDERLKYNSDLDRSISEAATARQNEEFNRIRIEKMKAQQAATKDFQEHPEKYPGLRYNPMNDTYGWAPQGRDRGSRAAEKLASDLYSNKQAARILADPNTPVQDPLLFGIMKRLGISATMDKPLLPSEHKKFIAIYTLLGSGQEAGSVPSASSPTVASKPELSEYTPIQQTRIQNYILRNPGKTVQEAVEFLKSVDKWLTP